MNVHTFGDVVSSKRGSLANDLEEYDEDDEREVRRAQGDVEGEEEDGDEKVWMYFKFCYCHVD